MNKILISIVAILSVLVIAAGVLGVAAEPQDSQKAYFKVKNMQGKAMIKSMEKYAYPNGVFVIETSSKNIEKLKKNKDLEFIDYADRVYVAESFLTQSMDSDLSSGNEQVASAPRSCTLADVNKKPVEYAIQYIYDDTTLQSTSGGLGVKIAILDTGANISHPDISQRISYCFDFNTGLSNCEDSSLTSHGTSIASLVGADSGADGLGMWGVAPQSNLYIMRTCRTALINGTWKDICDEPAIIAGIYDAVINRSVNIISMSFAGSSMSSQMQAALDYAYNHNVLLVAGAGNDGPTPNSIKYPAAYQKVISVGAITSSYAAWFNTSRGLNDGDYIREEREVEVAAPGHFVTAAKKNGCYRTDATGTSFATPLVAGLGAKIWNGNAISTRTILQDFAKLHDVDGFGDDTKTGFGLPTAPRDFEIRNLYVSPRSNKTVNGKIMISFDLVNTGNTNAFYTPVRIDVGSPSKSPVTFYVPALNATKKTTLFYSWSYDSTGSYTLTVSANPDGTIPELNTLNNTRMVDILIS